MAQSDDHRDQKTVYTGTLGSDITESDLNLTFSHFGEIVSINIISFTASYAAISFESSSSARKAIAGNVDAEFYSELMVVERPENASAQAESGKRDLEEETSRSGSKKMEKKTSQSKTIYTGTLGSDITESGLESIFSPFGDINSINTTSFTVRYATISFASSLTALNAVVGNAGANYFTKLMVVKRPGANYFTKSMVVKRPEIASAQVERGKRAQEETSRSRSKKLKIKNSQNTSIYVHNMGMEIRDVQLRFHLVSNCGIPRSEISSIEIEVDTNFDVLVKHGTVSFSTNGWAKQAIDYLNGFDFMGRRLSAGWKK